MGLAEWDGAVEFRFLVLLGTRYWYSVLGTGSVKIMRFGFGPRDDQRQNLLRFHGNDVVLVLQYSFHHQKLF